MQVVCNLQERGEQRTSRLLRAHPLRSDTADSSDARGAAQLGGGAPRAEPRADDPGERALPGAWLVWLSVDACMRVAALCRLLATIESRALLGA
jgi:hypothetical protein